MRRLTSIASPLLSGLGLVMAVVILNFLLIHFSPGDPVEVIVGEMGGASEELIARLREQYGLDKPLLVQLGIYIGKVATGDLGYSFYYSSPVLDLLLQRLPATILLVLTALVVAVLIGTVAGTISARRPNGFGSHLVTVFSLIGFSAPVFWIGMMLLILFASIWPIFPVAGMQSMRKPSGFAWYLDILHHLVLPATTLGMIYVAYYSRLARTSMIEALGQDYIRTARAKGVSEGRVVWKHALRNALIPIVTMVGLQFGQLFAGAVLVETVFNWPGLGRLAYNSIMRRDYLTLLGILLFSSVLVLVANALTDLIYRRIEPRMRKAQA